MKNEILDCLHEALDVLDNVLYEMEMDDRDGSEEYKTRCRVLNHIVDVIDTIQKGDRHASNF